MAREYVCLYHSYLKSVEPLNDAERGRLFTACLTYSMTGAEPDLRGNERFVWPTIREQIDRDTKKYSDFCKKQQENIRKRWDTHRIRWYIWYTRRYQTYQRKGKGEGEGEYTIFS